MASSRRGGGSPRVADPSPVGALRVASQISETVALIHSRSDSSASPRSSASALEVSRIARSIRAKTLGQDRLGRVQVASCPFAGLSLWRWRGTGRDQAARDGIVLPDSPSTRECRTCPKKFGRSGQATSIVASAQLSSLSRFFIARTLTSVQSIRPTGCPARPSEHMGGRSPVITSSTSNPCGVSSKPRARRRRRGSGTRSTFAADRTRRDHSSLAPACQPARHGHSLGSPFGVIPAGRVGY